MSVLVAVSSCLMTCYVIVDWLLGSYGLFEIAPGSWMMIHQLPEFLGFTGGIFEQSQS